jgi:enoyl-CoA hydratase/carnithine racemase
MPDIEHGGDGASEKTAATSAETPLVASERAGGVAVLSMVYRPHNLLGPKLTGAIVAAVRSAVEEGSRAVVLRSGLRNFCAGADVTLFSDTSPKERDPNALKPTEFLEFMETLPVPVVASVHGACLGGGFELALLADYVIAAASAKIGSVEIALGLHPLMGGIQRQVQRAGMLRAKELSMLGRRYDAATLERWNLINLVVEDEDLEAATMTIAQELANGPTVAHAATKRLAWIAANQGVLAADLAMQELQKPIWASEDLQAGLKSFRKNGPGLATFEGR